MVVEGEEGAGSTSLHGASTGTGLLNRRETLLSCSQKYLLRETKLHVNLKYMQLKKYKIIKVF